LGLQVLMSLVGFGDRDRARRILVQAMDNSRTLNATNPRKILAVSEEGIDESAAFMTGCWMDD
jgi:hypothetical protein